LVQKAAPGSSGLPQVRQRWPTVEPPAGAGGAGLSLPLVGGDAGRGEAV
jgi:hypothetical protein